MQVRGNFQQLPRSTNRLYILAMYFLLINLFLSNDIKFCILKVFLVNLFLYIYNILLDKGYNFLSFWVFVMKI